jgi:aminoglycoside N3'-acetyltransferase
MGTRYHYRADDIISALEALNIQQGDTVFVHSNVGFLGRRDDVSNIHRVHFLMRYKEVCDKAEK